MGRTCSSSASARQRPRIGPTRKSSTRSSSRSSSSTDPGRTAPTTSWAREKSVGSGRDRGRKLQVGCAAVLREAVEPVGRDVPAARETYDAVEAERGEAAQEIDPLLAYRPDMLITRVD